jgi:hypothetical protein
MPDPTQLEAHQTRLTATVRRATREAAVRRALEAFVPCGCPLHVPYRELLRQLTAAIAEELRSFSDASTPRIAPDPVSAGDRAASDAG